MGESAPMEISQNLFVLGQTMVMIGSLFAGHEESPGETKVENGVVLKEYFGSASEFQKGGKRKNVEGKKNLDPLQRFFERYFVEMQQDLQSIIDLLCRWQRPRIDSKVDYVIVKNSIFNGDTI